MSTFGRVKMFKCSFHFILLSTSFWNFQFSSFATALHRLSSSFWSQHIDRASKFSFFLTSMVSTICRRQTLWICYQIPNTRIPCLCTGVSSESQLFGIRGLVQNKWRSFDRFPWNPPLWRHDELSDVLWSHYLSFLACKKLAPVASYESWSSERKKNWTCLLFLTERDFKNWPHMNVINILGISCYFFL